MEDIIRILSNIDEVSPVLVLSNWTDIKRVRVAHL